MPHCGLRKMTKCFDQQTALKITIKAKVENILIKNLNFGIF